MDPAPRKDVKWIVIGAVLLLAALALWIALRDDVPSGAYQP